MSADSDDEGAGFGKPPKAHQFQPGQSGNPSGRPKGRKSWTKEDLIAQALGRLVRQRGPDGLEAVPVLRAVLDQALQDAARGDRHARRDVIRLMPHALYITSPAANDNDEPDDERDDEIARLAAENEEMRALLLRAEALADAVIEADEAGEGDPVLISDAISEHYDVIEDLAGFSLSPEDDDDDDDDEDATEPP